MARNVVYMIDPAAWRQFTDADLAWMQEFKEQNTEMFKESNAVQGQLTGGYMGQINGGYVSVAPPSPIDPSAVFPRLQALESRAGNTEITVAQEIQQLRDRVSKLEAALGI
jgi:hypothetical protein